jgi:hypothetical protein
MASGWLKAISVVSNVTGPRCTETFTVKVSPFPDSFASSSACRVANSFS